ncbi:MAG: ABC transporter permease subunit [Phycisphaerae bacterium]
MKRKAKTKTDDRWHKRETKKNSNMLMNRRILTIYTKELTELLRDRRTLIAMIVVPIALYPLLIIGSVHLLSVQDGERKTEKMTIGIQYDPEYPEDKQPAVRHLQRQLRTARNIIHDNLDDEPDNVVSNGLISIERMEIVVVNDVEQAVALGACHVGVVFQTDDEQEDHPAQQRVIIKYDKAELRSESAASRLRDVFDTLSRNLTKEILIQQNLPFWILDPIHVSAENVATPQKVGGMLLGSIVPLVLVLMTITGAIYPAIDLTAGERERGTLETLIVCPVPPVELMTGKYLVVATVAMMGAALNLISMGATLHFGGFTKMISASGDTELPLEVLPVILIVLIPFAMLFSAIMVAVCSYARTFKEAQNYIMPVILAALIPGGVAAMPGTELSGINAYVPVMNMVLLAREMLLGHFELLTITKVMLSTCVMPGRLSCGRFARLQHRSRHLRRLRIVESELLAAVHATDHAPDVDAGADYHRDPLSRVDVRAVFHSTYSRPIRAAYVSDDRMAHAPRARVDPRHAARVLQGADRFGAGFKRCETALHRRRDPDRTGRMDSRARIVRPPKRHQPRAQSHPRKQQHADERV